LIKGNGEEENLDYGKVLAQSKKAGFKHVVLVNKPVIEAPFTIFKKSYAFIDSYF